MSLDALDDWTGAQERGSDVHIDHPASGERLLTLRIVGVDSDIGRRAKLKMSDAYAAWRVSIPPADSREQIDREFLAAHIVGWNATRDGEAVTFSQAGVLGLLKIDFIRRAVETAIADPARWLAATEFKERE